MSKGMKALWLGAALTLALPSLTATADPRMMEGSMPGHHGMHKGDCHGHMDRMAKALGLTDAQKKQIDALHEQTRQAMQPLWKQKHEIMRKLWALNPDDRDYMRETKKLAEQRADLTEKMILAHAQSRAKFYAILTDAQKAKLKQMHEHRRGMHHHRMHGDMHGDMHGGSGGMGGGMGGVY